MYLLDTNHCSHLLSGHPTVTRRLELIGDGPVGTCVIVRGELIFMAQLSQQKITNLARINAFLQDIYLYPMDEQTADIYGSLKAAAIRHFGPKEKTKRQNVVITQIGFSDNDLWIAATALQHGLTIVSADSDFQRLQEVQAFSVESWWQPEPIAE
ncbi:MAG: type II toxin-antitoxin system VapC family toxin [Abitibacteriaceae bacterium]|nr:type II toxin-antitoxin system VapC family toxin [Abditibacteriaceae bacterium]MBV9867360.1 type II toxin-antitoxin system VapC family toxin [Abditibacteriaceae bacterium]